MRGILLLVVCFSAYFVATSGKPTFSKAYHIKGTLFIPYTELKEPFEAWYDERHNRSRIDYYGGTVNTIQLGNKYEYGTAIKVTPVTTETETNVKTCLQYNGTSEEDEITPQSVLPDLTGFQRIGSENINGQSCEKWRLIVTKGYKVNNYTAYITQKVVNGINVAVPVRYEMRGFNNLLGSHYDHYYVQYSDYSARSPSPSVFKVPAHLQCVPYGFGTGHYVYTFNPIKEFIHDDIKHVDHVWAAFHKKHQRSIHYKSEKEHVERKNVFHQNFRYIESMNRANLGYKLAVNHLADRTDDEIRVLRGRRPSSAKNNDNEASPFPYTDEFLERNAPSLPADIDWRLFGAVTPVKDQSVCGSCWAFGTTGTLEGSYFLKYGNLTSLSEQALVDCSWGFDNNGCDGGLDTNSYKWIKKHGGIPLEAEYGPYLGENGYCTLEDKTLVASLKSFVNVKRNSTLALKTALVNHGPISVAIDAAHRSFSFYSHGVYYEPSCGSSDDDLDHAVLLVGYGKLNGTAYWLVKNSWSNYWGNDGYILFNPLHNNCGVMTEPTYAVLD